MRSFLLAAATAATLVAVPCAALTTYSPVDYSDLWWNADESGWGLNLVQQNDTIFATLYVYGADGKARWYSASALQGANGGASFSGRLYEATGPGIAGPFDPSRVTRRDVGDMTIAIRDDNSADLRYTVDGVTVQKRITRATWRTPKISGSFAGYRDVIGQCATGTPHEHDPASMTIGQSQGSFNMSLYYNDNTCTYSGTPQAAGRLLDVTGTYSCSLGNNNGTFELSRGTAAADGFVTHVRTTPNPASSVTCPQEGHLVAVPTTTQLTAVDVSELWWNPAESGWGLNLQQQGDTVFATLYVYGPDGQPRWYSASDMAATGNGFTGRLYESTGPGFATAFKPAAVARRDVGPIQFEIVGASDGRLSYSVDGTVVTKDVTRLTMKANDVTGSVNATYSWDQSCGSASPVRIGGGALVNIQQANGGFSMSWFSAGPCQYNGAYDVHGHLGSASGTFTCGPGAMSDGRFQLGSVEKGRDGLLMHIQQSWTGGDGVRCTASGSLAGSVPLG